MVDSGIKKARFSLDESTTINSETEGYTLRYRVISEDKNRTSHWSPIQLIVPEYTFVPGSIAIATANQIASFTWDSVVILKNISTSQTISNKQITSKLATITTSSAHYLVVNDWVTVSGVDSTFDGTYKISAVTANTFSYYKDNANISSTAVSPSGTYKKNQIIRNALDYDVHIRWDRNDAGDWIYKERVRGTSVSFPHATTYTKSGVVQASAPNRVSIEIYLKGYPVQRGDGVPLSTGTPFLKVYQIANQTI